MEGQEWTDINHLNTSLTPTSNLAPPSKKGQSLFEPEMVAQSTHHALAKFTLEDISVLFHPCQLLKRLVNRIHVLNCLRDLLRRCEKPEVLVDEPG